jgi:hypothetical protein
VASKDKGDDQVRHLERRKERRQGRTKIDHRRRVEDTLGDVNTRGVKAFMTTTHELLAFGAFSFFLLSIWIDTLKFRVYTNLGYSNDEEQKGHCPGTKCWIHRVEGGLIFQDYELLGHCIARAWL